jgi:hypothetical protein
LQLGSTSASPLERRSGKRSGSQLLIDSLCQLHQAGIFDPTRARLWLLGGGDPVDTISARTGRDVRPQRPRLWLEPEVVIGFVRSNPEPVILAVPFAGDRAIASATFYGVDAALLLES